MKKVDGGGQGHCMFVEPIAGERAKRFLKVLKLQSDRRARQRFFREASGYLQFDHARLPRLIESNAQKIEDRSYKLYTVTELIPGLNLAEYVTNNGPLSLDDGLDLAVQLLDVVRYLHNEQCIHRDIKPRNIILRNDQTGDPVLVDLGLSYRADYEARADLTAIGHEVGNRFLRLPELASQSTLKHDARSDIAFIGGILFFALTGMAPALLSDADGLMPHQRSAASLVLNQVANGRGLRLMAFLDRAFAGRINDRFSTADEMLDAIARLQVPTEVPVTLNIKDMQAQITAHIDSARNQELAHRLAATQNAVNVVTSIAAEIANSTNGLYRTLNGGGPASNNSITIQFGFFHAGDDHRRFFPVIESSVVGYELLVRIDDEQVLRTDVSEPQLDEDFKNRVRAIYLRELSKLLQTE